MPLRKDAKSPLSVSLWFLQVVIVLVLISLVIWLSLKPKHPIYTISSVYFPDLDRENSTLHNETMPKTFVVQLNFEIWNPNKRIGIYYDDTNTTLYSKDAVVIGTNSLPGFYQGYKDTIFYEVLVNTDHQQLRKGITSNSTNMIIRVQLETSVMYKILQSKTKHHRMNFEACLDIGSDGRMSGDRDIKLQYKGKND